MHDGSTVEKALALGEAGLSATQISAQLGISRSTIRTWLKGDLPRAAVTRHTPLGGRCDACGGEAHKFAELPREYVYLLGMYLGDGCLSAHPRGVYKLRLTLDAIYPEIIDECRRAINAVMPRAKIGEASRGGGFDNSQNGASLELYSYSRAWPCLFPQHGPGRRHQRLIELTDWQEALVALYPQLLLRGLIHSDGCRFINTGTNWVKPRYSFSNRSDDIRRIFCKACDLLGLRCTMAPNTVYVSRKADVEILDSFIGPKR